MGLRERREKGGRDRERRRDRDIQRERERERERETEREREREREREKSMESSICLLGYVLQGVEREGYSKAESVCPLCKGFGGRTVKSPRHRQRCVDSTYLCCCCLTALTCAVAV